MMRFQRSFESDSIRTISLALPYFCGVTNLSCKFSDIISSMFCWKVGLSEKALLKYSDSGSLCSIESWGINLGKFLPVDKLIMLDSLANISGSVSFVSSTSSSKSNFCIFLKKALQRSNFASLGFRLLLTCCLWLKFLSRGGFRTNWVAMSLGDKPFAEERASRNRSL